MKKSSRKNSKSKKTSVNKIAGKIRKDILFGNLKPGEHLKEYRLARIYKVSRVPIREAFRILHSEGYVEMIPNRGSFVKKTSVKQFIEYYMAYKLIGPVVLKDSIPRYNSSTYKKAYTILEKVEKSKDIYKTSCLLWDFGKVIFGKSEYKFLICIMDEVYKHNIRAISDMVLNIQHLNYDTSPHRNFLKLCQSGKNDEALNHWFDYVEKLSQSMLKTTQ